MVGNVRNAVGRRSIMILCIGRNVPAPESCRQDVKNAVKPSKIAIAKHKLYPSPVAVF